MNAHLKNRIGCAFQPKAGGIHIFIPGEAEEIIAILESNGHEAYLVGGCVRDALMGKTPKDYDICTSAITEQVITLFDKTIPTGLKHGTVTVLKRGLPFEVTTFRTDAEYTDHRRARCCIFFRFSDGRSETSGFLQSMPWPFTQRRGSSITFKGMGDLQER
jgi:tRNA nucleotidyltransferase (CCA-adding enzyme)